MLVFQRRAALSFFFQWGEAAAKYDFDPDDLVSSARARRKAHKQGQAVRARQRAAGEPYGR